MPNVLIAQYLTLALTAALFTAAFILGLRHMKKPPAENADNAAPPQNSMGLLARLTVVLATAIGTSLLLWRAASEKKITLPLTNHFDAFLVCSLLLAIVLMYFRWTRHLRSLSFFMLPMIAAMLVLGGILEAVSPGPYHYESVWTKIHIVTVVSGTLCFALACVSSAVYLMAAKQLKNKGTPMGMGPARTRHRWIGFPPLASMEKFNQWMVYLGFPLLSIAMVTGILRIAQLHLSDTQPATTWQMSPKFTLAFLAWLTYAVLLHLPLAPSFRGARAAWLSILGFVFFLGGFIAVIWTR